MFLEHRYEGAGAVVARVDGRGSHLLARSENLERVHQPQLAAPFIETQIRFRDERSLNGPLASSATAAELIQSGLRPWLLRQKVDHPPDPRIRRARQL